MTSALGVGWGYPKSGQKKRGCVIVTEIGGRGSNIWPQKLQMYFRYGPFVKVTPAAIRANIHLKLSACCVSVARRFWLMQQWGHGINERTFRRYLVTSNACIGIRDWMTNWICPVIVQSFELTFAPAYELRLVLLQDVILYNLLFLYNSQQRDTSTL